MVKALIHATPYTCLYPNWAGEPLSTNHSCRDAAHTHGGAFAAGGSLVIDDSYVSFLAFCHVYSLSSVILTNESSLVKHIQKALTLYDRTRRPHVERLLNTVLNCIKTGQQHGYLSMMLRKLSRSWYGMISKGEHTAKFPSRKTTMTVWKCISHPRI